MKILVIGCGSIGERHIKNLSDLGVKGILCHDVVSGKSEAMRKHGARPVNSVEEGLKQRPDAALICTPTAYHMESALKAAEKCHVFIEKPISHTLDGIDRLLKTARESGKIIMTGYNLRFNPGLLKVRELLSQKTIGKVMSARIEYGQYLPDWRPSQDYRKSYSAKKSLGGGIILDCVHEIDYARWLLGEPKEIFCVAGKFSDLEIDVEDLAEILMKFRSGVVANLHLDALQRVYRRNCQIIGSKGTILWDFKPGRVKWFSNGKWNSFESGRDYTEDYVDEMRYFLDCVKKGARPESDGESGKRTLEIALAARESASAGKVMSL